MSGYQIAWSAKVQHDDVKENCIACSRGQNIEGHVVVHTWQEAWLSRSRQEIKAVRGRQYLLSNATK